MKNLSIIIGVLLSVVISSSSTFANCKAFVTLTDISPKQEQMVQVKLDELKYELTTQREDADFFFDISKSSYSSSQKNYWEANIFYGRTKYDAGDHAHGDELAKMVPIGILTLGLGELLIPSSGDLAVRHALKKLPSCEDSNP